MGVDGRLRRWEARDVAGIFTVADLDEVADAVAQAWEAGAEREWSVPAGTLEWSCAKTADHAIDTLIAPAFFLASRRTDRYPAGGWSPGETATPRDFIDAVGMGARLLGGVVSAAEADATAILFRNPPTIGVAADFAPRGALELAIHAHDVCVGLGIAFEPPRQPCEHLRQHVRSWPFWGGSWPHLSMDGDPWLDILRSSGRLTSLP